MVNIIICDDNKVIVEKYRIKIQMLAKMLNFEVEISAAYSGEELLFKMEDMVDDIDIIILDVLMGKITGIETANMLREKGCLAEIIFLTSSEDYVFKAFDSSPVQYLLKSDVTDEKFASVLKKAVEIVKKKNKKIFTYRRDKVTYHIILSDISYFDIINRVVSVHYDNQCEEFYSTMDELYNRLNRYNFERIHRSYLINLNHVSSVNKANVLLIDGTSLPLGATFRENFLKRLSAHTAMKVTQ